MISIVIPVYNASRTLRTCVDSVLCQGNCEILLIDDGSTDGSSLICDNYAEENDKIKVIHQIHGGVSVARNTGLDNASGEWIAFVDADDYIDNLFYPASLDESVDLYIQKYTYFGDDHSFPYETIESQTVEGNNIRFFLSDNAEKCIFRVPWGKIFKRSIITNHNIKFDVRFRIGEDTLFVQTYIRYVRKVEVLAKGEYHYCFIDGNDVKKYSQPLSESVRYIDEFWKVYRENGIDSVALLKFILSFFQQLSSDCFTSRLDYLYWESSRGVLAINQRLKVFSGIYGRCKYVALHCLSYFIRNNYNRQR